MHLGLFTGSEAIKPSTVWLKSVPRKKVECWALDEHIVSLKAG